MKPDWHEYYMGEAFWAATRSHDTKRRVGAVIVNNQKREICRGYNGFPSDIADTDLDTHGPNKLKWMVHAEVNAVANLNEKIYEKTEIYVTRPPCNNCAKLLWQKKIRIWNIPLDCVDFESGVGAIMKTYDEDENQLLDVLLKAGLVINYIDFNIDDVVRFLKEQKPTLEH